MRTLSAFVFRIPRMELLEVVTIGLPFCCFKILGGLAALTWIQDEPSVLLMAVGVVFVALGLLDFLINGLNLISLLLLGRRVLDACLLSVVLRRIGRFTAHPEAHWRDFGNSTDVLLSFMIVAVMVGKGFLNLVPPEALALWNTCVVFNVLGAGLSRFGTSLKAFRV